MGWKHHTKMFPVGCYQGVRRFFSPRLHRITLVIAGCRVMKDTRRHRSFRFLQAWRRLFAISKPSKRWSIGIDIQRPGNGGEARWDCAGVVQRWETECEGKSDQSWWAKQRIGCVAVREGSRLRRDGRSPEGISYDFLHCNKRLTCQHELFL